MIQGSPRGSPVSILAKRQNKPIGEKANEFSRRSPHARRARFDVDPTQSVLNGPADTVPRSSGASSFISD
jgi:hypothetical protein